MATVAELIIAASVEPSGIRSGLDQGAGYLRQFGKTAQQEIEETLKAFPNMGLRTGMEIGTALIGGLEPQFQSIQARLREQLARGVISEETFRKEGALAAQAFNQALLVGIEEIRGGGFMQAGDALETELVGKLKQTGIEAGMAFKRGLGGAGADQALVGMGRIRMGLTSLLAQYTETIPVLDRIGGQLVAVGAGGNIALGAIAGITAIAAAYHFATKEASELADAQDKASESLKKWMQLRAAGVGGQTQLDVDSARQKLASLGAQLATQNNRVIAFAPGSEGYIAAKKIADALKQSYDEQATLVRSGEQHLAEIRATTATSAVAEVVRNMAAVIEAGDATPGLRANAERLMAWYDEQIKRLKGNPLALNEMTNDIANRDALDNALHPKAKGGRASHDRGPFADEKDAIGELTTAFEALHKAGLPVGDLYDRIDAASRHVRDQLDALKDKTGAEANALRAILRDIDQSGVNAPDPRLAHSAPLALGSSDDAFGKSTEAAIQRIQLLRDSLGEMNGDTLTAERGLTQMLDGVNARIEAQGGALHASNALLEIQRSLMKEIADEQKSQGSAIWTPEDSAEIQRQIKAAMDALHKGLHEGKTDIADLTAAAHGLVDTLAGLGVIGPNVTQAVNSALHAAEAIDRLKTKGATDAGNSAADKIAGAIGIFGGAVGAIGALASIFSQGNAIQAENNARLSELRAALQDSKGVGGDQRLVSALEDYSAKSGQYGGMSIDDLAKEAGMTWDEITARAKSLGMVASDGTIDLKAFSEALRLSIEAAQRFSNSLSDQTSLEDLRRKVYGLSEPIDALKSSLMLLAKESPALSKEFGLDGIDATTTEGQAKLRKALQAMYDKLAAGTLTPEELAAFGGAKEFAAWLASASDGLDALTKATSAAAGAMLNVPTGYKIALDRFNAIDPVVPQPFAPGGPTDKGGGTTGPSGVVAQVQGSSQSTTYQFTAPIYIDARDKTGEQLLEEVLKAARRRGYALTGQPNAFVE